MQTTSEATTWWQRAHGNDERELLVAYFSMEFGLHERLPIYSGGLGVLAGDHLKAAAELGVPLVGVGLLYRGGYFRQGIDRAGRQTEDYHHPVDAEAVGVTREPVSVSVDLAGETIEAAVWRKDVGSVTLYLLEVDWLTDALYGGDREHRIRQELLLGVGGVRALAALGIEPTVFHLNEGHSAFLQIERVRALVEQGLETDDALEQVRASSVFTTHTPVPAGNELFDEELVVRYVGKLAAEAGLDREALLELGRFGDKPGFGLTPLALRLSAYANGVSELHGSVAREMWQPLWPGQETPIGHVTNGVHLGTWLEPALTELLRANGVSPEAPPGEANWDAARQMDNGGALAGPRRLEGAARRARRDRPRAPDHRVRPPVRHLQARRPRLLRDRAPARAAGPDRRRRQGASRRRAGQGRDAAHRRARARPAPRRPRRLPRELRHRARRARSSAAVTCG